MNRKHLIIALAVAILIALLWPRPEDSPRQDDAVFPDAPEVDVSVRSSFTLGDSGIPIFEATPEERALNRQKELGEANGQ